MCDETGNPELDLYASTHNLKVPKAPIVQKNLLDRRQINEVKLPPPFLGDFHEEQSVVQPVPGFVNKPISHIEFPSGSRSPILIQNSKSPCSPEKKRKKRSKKVIPSENFSSTLSSCTIRKPTPVVEECEIFETNKEVAAATKTLERRKRRTITSYMSPDVKSKSCLDRSIDTEKSNSDTLRKNSDDPFETATKMNTQTPKGIQTIKIRAPHAKMMADEGEGRSSALVNNRSAVPRYLGLNDVNMDELSDEENERMGDSESEENSDGVSDEKSLKDDIPPDFETVEAPVGDDFENIATHSNDDMISNASEESNAHMGEPDDENASEDAKGGWLKDGDDCIVNVEEVEADISLHSPKIPFAGSEPNCNYINGDVERHASKWAHCSGTSDKNSKNEACNVVSSKTQAHNDVSIKSEEHRHNSQNAPRKWEFQKEIKMGVEFVENEKYRNELNHERHDRIMAHTMFADFELFPSLLDVHIDKDKDFVLCELSPHGVCVPLPEKPSSTHFDYGQNQYVRMPHSQALRGKYSIFQEVQQLMVQFNTSTCVIRFEHVENLFTKLAELRGGPYNFDGLRAYYKRNVERFRTEDQREYEVARTSFSNAMKIMAKFVSLTTNYLTESIPLLQDGVRSVTLSLNQCSCLLALAFFGMMPGRSVPNGVYQSFDLRQFYRKPVPILQEKLAFILNYFTKISECGGSRPGCVTFTRRTLQMSDIPDWKNSNIRLSLMSVLDEGLIEDKENTLHVDFANKYIGGGILSSGAVQEEIRFLCCPDMIVSLLLVPKMRMNEAILISGAPKVSSYTGYSRNLKFDPTPPVEELRMDRFGRFETEMVAIDAIEFSANAEQQYRKECIDRELMKAFVGFYNPSHDQTPKPVSTGNWGCGVFGGDIYLKSMIQLMAASVNNRAVIYHTFRNKDIRNKLDCMWMLAARYNLTVGNLYDILITYRQAKEEHPINCFLLWFTKYIKDKVDELEKNM